MRLNEDEQLGAAAPATPHLLENLGGAAMYLSSSELAELNAAASSIQIQGARPPESVLVLSELEAPSEK